MFIFECLKYYIYLYFSFIVYAVNLYVNSISTLAQSAGVVEYTDYISAVG